MDVFVLVHDLLQTPVMTDVLVGDVVAEVVDGGVTILLLITQNPSGRSAKGTQLAGEGQFAFAVHTILPGDPERVVDVVGVSVVVGIVDVVGVVDVAVVVGATILLSIAQYPFGLSANGTQLAGPGQSTFALHTILPGEPAMVVL